MQEFNEGDLVEAVHGETVARWRVGEDNPLQMAMWEIELLYTLRVIEKAAPKLPTEPGTYRAANGSTWTLFKNGDWFDNLDGSIAVRWNTRDFNGTRGVLPFIRLEPVPVTAKKVLDAIRQRIGSIDSAHDFQAVATQFGITE